MGFWRRTWLLSAQGARTESGDYLQVILLTAVAVAVALPLYYYRAHFGHRDHSDRPIMSSEIGGS